MAATGGRLDHTLENLVLLSRFGPRGSLALLTGEQRIVAVHDDLAAATTPGDTVSLMPLGCCPRVWTTGLHWELSGEPLDLVSHSSVSNRAEGASIRVRVSGGVVLLFLPDH
jgi:thiamine pyrophosphokinase